MAKALKPYQPKREVIARPRESRGNRHERGYDNDWERAAEAFRRRYPFCAECEHKGLTILCDAVDHKIPVKCRPDLRMVPSNWWSLCNLCHNGIKRRMEGYAIKAGLIDKLPAWCDDPSTRPPALLVDRPSRKEEMIV